MFQFIFLSDGLRFRALRRGGITVGSVSPAPLPFVFSCTSRFNSPFHAFAAHPCYGTNFVSVFQFIFLSGGLLSSCVHLVSTLLFMRSPHALATVRTSFPCFSSFSFRVVFETHGRPRWGFRNNIRLFLRVGLCMSVVQNTTWTFVGLSSGQPVTYHQSLRWYGGGTLKGFYHTSSSSLLFLSMYFLFYYPLNVQPRFQTILQTPLHLAFSWLGLWSTVERAERFRLILVHPYHLPLVCEFWIRHGWGHYRGPV